MGGIDRRTFLGATAASGAAVALGRIVLGASDAHAAGTHVSGKVTKVEIVGMYTELPGVISVDPGRARATLEKNSQGKWTYVTHGYDNLVIVYGRSSAHQKLEQWAGDAQMTGGSGDNLLRDITIRLHGNAGVAKTIACSGCFPVSLGGPADSRTLTCRVNRIEVS